MDDNIKNEGASVIYGQAAGAVHACASAQQQVSMPNIVEETGRNSHSVEPAAPRIASFIKRIGPYAASNFFEAVSNTGAIDILTSEKVISFLSGIGSECAASTLEALSSAQSLKLVSENSHMAQRLMNFLKHSGPDTAWGFFRAAESTGRVEEIASDRVLGFAKRIGRERAAVYFKVIEETHAVDELTSETVINKRAVNILKNTDPYSADSFFITAAKPGMPELLTGKEMSSFYEACGSRLTGLLLNALERSAMPRETAVYYMKMANEAHGAEAMRISCISYDESFIKAASAAIEKRSYEPYRYVSIMSIYSHSSGREELDRMLSEEGYAVGKLDSKLSDHGIRNVKMLSMNEKTALISAGTGYISECAEQIDKFLLMRSLSAAEAREYMRREGFAPETVMGTRAIAQIQGSRVLITAYTVDKKANALAISAKETACCSFLPKGGKEWATLGYANDPAVILINFKLGRADAVSMEKGSPDGIAICALATVDGKKALYVNSVEGGHAFRAAARGRELQLASLIDDYAKKVNADSAVFNNAFRNETPKMFAEALSNAAHKVIPMDAIKLLSRKDTYFEKSSAATKLVR